MKKLKLNPNVGQIVSSHGYQLDASQQYVIDIKNEMNSQLSIAQTVQTMGLDAMTDWYTWLNKNGFNLQFPNPTNKFVESFYGKKPLWKTNLSQGIVVKNLDDDDFYIVMECSRNNKGFKYTEIVLTLGGCL